ncbi:hypothetical protein CB1_082350001 [Camelus ferus]|nr:hypothetical protein CB1_082350001 [Camelus ferus]
MACRPQDVFLMIWCHKTAIFTGSRQSSIVFQLKCSVQGILKRPVDDQLLDDSKTLGEVWLHQPDSMAAGRPQ